MQSQIEFARKLVELFYPLVEMTLFDEKGSIIEIANAFSSRKEDQECDFNKSQKESPFPELLAIGRTVRTLISPFPTNNKTLGYIRLRYDLTHFKNLQEQLSFLMKSSDQPKEETIDSWNHSIDQIINHFLTDNKINLGALTGKQKRELISHLQTKGLFDFKESSAYVASKLQISRATVYNYLKTTSDLQKIRIHQVDAFTNKRFGGNPAGVVLDADGLSEATMRKIARELNLSETAFVFACEKEDFQLRYFTPTGHEISFCGHSTVGSLYMIAKERRFGINKAGKYDFAVKTHCGTINMEVSLDKEDEIRLAYEAPPIKLVPSKITHKMVAEAAGFDISFIDQTYPVMYEKTNKDLFVVIKTLDVLKQVECDPKSFAQFSKTHDIVALCLVTTTTFDKDNQFHTRCFCPMVGIAEDPFTGSMLGGLAAYTDSLGLLPKNSNQFRVEQGHFIDRPGVVRVEFSKNKKGYEAKIHAQAVHCFSTEINLT